MVFVTVSFTLAVNWYRIATQTRSLLSTFTQGPPTFKCLNYECPCCCPGSVPDLGVLET